MALEGKDTSEHKMAVATKWINLVVVVLGGILSALHPDSVVYVILASVIAAANAFTSSAYTKGRSIVKANALPNP